MDQASPPVSEPAPVPGTARQIAGVPQNVALLGLVSLFADISSEMIYPLVPVLLTTVLGAPVVAVGLIEGVAESTASLMRLGAGW